MMPEDWHALSSFYHKLYIATDGKVTPLIGQVMADAGYDATYSFQKKQLHTPPKWDEVLQITRHSLTTTRPVLLDFGAAGKGYLIDIIGRLVADAGITSYLINAGGDMLHRSADNTAVAVGMENPKDSSEAVGIIQLANQSLCASAGSKRAWSDIHHIIDPTTLSSTQDSIATWVIAESTMVADGIATALFFSDANKLAQTFVFDYAILDKNMQLHRSKNFPGTVFDETAQ
jgi:FAD:protein FMN transferase